MVIRRNLQLVIFILFFTLNVNSQNKQTHTRTKYSYTFSGLGSSTNIEKITNEIEVLKGVTQCKVIIKLEQNMGQVIVLVEEYSRSSEGQEMFEPIDLKKIIIKNGLIPVELTTESFDK